MKHSIISAAALIALLGSAAAFADYRQGFYAGASLSRWSYDQQLPAADGRLQTLDINGGFWFNPLLSAEVRLGTSLGDEEVEVGDTQWELGIDYYGSVYWRPEVGNEVAKLYGLLGYTQLEMTGEVLAADADAPVDLSDSGPSFGAGIGFAYNEQVWLNLEWKQLIDADGFEISGVTAGFDYRF